MPRENHKQRLLEGALECLRTKGYARTTSRDIAAAAGANLGSIGYHYGSKDALLNAALIEGFRAWTEQISSRATEARSDDPLERLRLTWEIMRADLQDQQGLLQAFLEALAPASRTPELREELARFYRESRGEIAGVIAESLSDTDNHHTAARVLASILIAVTDGLQLQWFLEPDETPSAEQIGAALAVAFAALAATAPPGIGHPGA